MVKVFGNAVAHLAAVVALVGVLSVPVMVTDAMAQTACNARGACPNGGTCVNNICQPAPEMSDYLAMTLVVSSLGAIFYIRRRSLVIV